MTTGVFCSCDERHKPVRLRSWVVIQRECNHSAFSGYRWTPSAYSQVHCPQCLAVWRTKAAYVAQLEDGNFAGVNGA
jgi:hypothetical protein